MTCPQSIKYILLLSISRSCTMRTVWVIIVHVLHIRGVISYTFDVNNVLLVGQDSVRGTHFSYSLLLQAGENISSVIVGAPKNIRNTTVGGELYKCDIDTIEGVNSCVQYPTGRAIDTNTPNGNVFGMSLDGDNHVNGALVACAPRTIAPQKTTIPYLRGHCVYIRNSSHITDPAISLVPLDNPRQDTSCCDAFGKPFYNFGFAMAGFDVSYYSEDEILLGAPGVRRFNGAAIVYSLDQPRILNLLPYRMMPYLEDDDTYFGYSVTSAKFQRNSDQLWFVAGAPRGNNLKGKVTIYYYDVSAKEKMSIVTIFEGQEMGAYFGAAVLALDVTNDGVVDIMVGAPTSAGKTWDEGAVMFYKGINEKTYLRSTKLIGMSKTGSRFGSAVVSLGDFDLDGFNDIAISSPYEDNGRGAVYIYRGGPVGLLEPFSQKLSPTDFGPSGASAKGFGIGISRGNDIDGNGHNDIAIGAYKSDQVFIIRSYSIIDFLTILNSQIESIQDDTKSFDINFCLVYTKRSHKNILQSVKFKFFFDLDYRSGNSSFVDEATIYLARNFCKKYTIGLQQMLMDISPFQVNLRVETETDQLVAQGQKSLNLQLPYSHGCGDDNTCRTSLSINLKSDRDKIVLGLDKFISLMVLVNNNGEPAYHCQVAFTIPDNIELRNRKDCIKTEQSYVCLISRSLTGAIDKEFIFDLKDIQPNIETIQIAAQVSSLGVNNPENQDKSDLVIPVVLDSTPYIVGKSIPDVVDMEIKSSLEKMEVEHQFSIGKNGVSPLKVDVDVLIPFREYKGKNVFEVTDIEGTIDSIPITCSFIEKNHYTDSITYPNIVTNRTIIIDCTTNSSCLRYSCKGEYLYNSGQLAILRIKMVIWSNLLASTFKDDLTEKDIIAIMPVAFQRIINGSKVSDVARFLIFAHGVNYVPLWVYLLGASVGGILLILIVFALCKCHFFDRIYKEKLEQEKTLILQDGSVEDEIFEDVVFRPMTHDGIDNKEYS